jgi:hypothetical protein
MFILPVQKKKTWRYLPPGSSQSVMDVSPILGGHDKLLSLEEKYRPQIFGRSVRLRRKSMAPKERRQTLVLAGRMRRVLVCASSTALRRR